MLLLAWLKKGLLMQRFFALAATVVAMVGSSMVPVAAADTITIDECDFPMAINRQGAFADFTLATPDERRDLEVLLESLGRRLDALYLSPDHTMWVSVVHQRGFVTIPEAVWVALKRKLGAGMGKPAGDAVALKNQQVLDQGTRLIVSYTGWGETKDGFVNAAMAETLDYSTGCLVRLTLRTENLELAPTLAPIMADMTISRLQ